MRSISTRAGAGKVVSQPCNAARLPPCPRPVLARAVEPATTSSKESEPRQESLKALEALASTQTGTANAAEASIAALTEKLLMADPETAEQLKRYQEAVARVEAAKAAAQELEKQYAEAGRELALSQAQEEAEVRRQAAEVMAAAEVAAAEKMLAVAQLEAAQAQNARTRWAVEATQDTDRYESVKAGLFAAGGGAVSALTLALASPASTGDATGLSTVLSLGASLASCFLFGVTYRYAVRTDEANSHLRNGAVGAFGLVHGAAGADVLQATAGPAGPLDVVTVVGPAALYTGQSMILFAFAGAALEVAFRQGWVTRFGANNAQSSASGSDAGSSSSSGTGSQ